MVAFAADAGTFTPLRGQDVGVSPVGVAPTQVGLHRAGQDQVVGLVGVADHE